MSAPSLPEALVALRMALDTQRQRHEEAAKACARYADALLAGVSTTEQLAAYEEAARSHRASEVRCLGASVLVGEVTTVARTALAHARSAGEVA